MINTKVSHWFDNFDFYVEFWSDLLNRLMIYNLKSRLGNINFATLYIHKMDLSETSNINYEKYFMHVNKLISKIFDLWV